MAWRVCEPIDACPSVDRAGAADAGILRRPLLRVGREDQTLPLTLTLTLTLTLPLTLALTHTLTLTLAVALTLAGSRSS